MNVSFLKKFIVEIIKEIQDYRVPNQLISKNGKKNGKQDKEKDLEDEMEEMSIVANVAGFTGPLGASSEDMNGPVRKKKKSSARWK